jgi:hypothetical protein
MSGAGWCIANPEAAGGCIRAEGRFAADLPAGEIWGCRRAPAHAPGTAADRARAGTGPCPGGALSVTPHRHGFAPAWARRPGQRVLQACGCSIARDLAPIPTPDPEAAVAAGHSPSPPTPTSGWSALAVRTSGRRLGSSPRQAWCSVQERSKKAARMAADRGQLRQTAVEACEGGHQQEAWSCWRRDLPDATAGPPGKRVDGSCNSVEIPVGTTRRQPWATGFPGMPWAVGARPSWASLGRGSPDAVQLRGRNPRASCTRCNVAAATAAARSRP